MEHQVDLLYSRFRLCNGISIDSRTVESNNLFFGLSGPNFNGSQYAEMALEKGATFAVIDDESFLGDDRIILVDDALKALQELATFHRNQLRCKVFGITGSNGKTTTKELIREVLSQKYRVHATIGNLNNHIGVPLTLLQLTDEVEIAIVEMGANHVGEIATLSEIARPDYGLITNIGYAHTEGFGGIEGVMRGKSELFDYLRKTGGTPFINTQDDRLKNMGKRFSNANDYPDADVIESDTSVFMGLTLDNHPIKTQLTGGYNFINAAAAISVGRFFEVSDERITKALEAYSPGNHRSQIIENGTNTIILDAYNANPDSMRVSLQNLASFKGNRIAILGDMNELSNSDDEHRSLGNLIAKLNLEEVILVGEKIRPALETIPKAKHFETTEELMMSVKLNDFQDSVILLKASRMIKLECVVDDL